MEEVTGGPDSLVAVGAGWWSLILLPASLALNLTAFFSLVRRAGSCYRDPATPPLLSLTAANLLHCTLVQVSSAVSGMVITMGRQSPGSVTSVCSELCCRCLQSTSRRPGCSPSRPGCAARSSSPPPSSPTSRSPPSLSRQHLSQLPPHRD